MFANQSRHLQLTGSKKRIWLRFKLCWVPTACHKACSGGASCTSLSTMWQSYLSAQNRLINSTSGRETYHKSNNKAEVWREREKMNSRQKVQYVWETGKGLGVKKKKKEKKMQVLLEPSTRKQQGRREGRARPVQFKKPKTEVTANIKSIALVIAENNSHVLLANWILTV